LDASGEPRIADLGLSRAHKRMLREARIGSLATDIPKVRGTFDYLAPEVRRGGDIAPASDVYALGVFFYELLVGSRPLGAFPLPGEVVGPDGTVGPAALDRVVSRALAHEAGDRYPDAGTMLADLRAGHRGIALSRAGAARAPGRNDLLLSLE